MGNESQAPRTLREKYMQEREQLYAALLEARKAYLEVSSGRVASYSLGNRSVTRSVESLGSLQSWMDGAANRIAEIEAILQGRPVRHRSPWSYGQPQSTFWRW